jgi:hypothetical protein
LAAQRRNYLKMSPEEKWASWSEQTTPIRCRD